MKAFTNRAGLCITEDKVQLVEVSLKEDKIHLENVDEEFFEDSLSPDIKEAKFIYILQNAFNEILLRQPLISKQISIALPPSFFNIVEIPVDKNLTKNDLNEYIKWELTKLYPYETNDELVFQKVVLNPLNFESYKRVVVYSFSKNLLNRIHKFCSRNNLTLKFVDSSHLASIGLVKGLLKDGNNISLYICKNTFNLSLFENGGLYSEEVINYKNLPELLELFSSKIETLAQNSSFSGQLNKLFLFGNNIGREFRQTLKENYEFDLVEINPFNSLIVNKELQSNRYVEESNCKFTAATSLALRI